MLSSRGIMVAAAAVVAGLALTSPARAQQRGAGGLGGRMGQGGDVIMLLAMEPVQKELKLTDAQKTAAREAGDELRSTFAGLRDLSQEERREKMQELGTKTKDLRTKVEATLDAAQKDRLKQLVLQRRGAFGALQDPEVVTALKLSDEQKKKVETLAEESRPPSRPRRSGRRWSRRRRRAFRGPAKGTQRQGDRHSFGRAEGRAREVAGRKVRVPRRPIPARRLEDKAL